MLQHLPPQLQQLLQTKQGRIKLAAGGVGVLLLLILIFSGGDSEPEIPVQQAAPIEKPAPPAPPNTDNSKIILDLFNPSDASLEQQHTETTSTQQIEQTMTITFVLAKCQAISQDDYSTVFRALIIYAQAVKLAPDAATAEARVREIASASSASYSLIYSRLPCDDPQIAPLAKQVLLWADGMFKLN